MSRPSTAGALVIALVALAGCGRLTRTATLNQNTEVSGLAAQSALQQELTQHGLAGATVHCARTLIVYVGTATSCSLTGAGSRGQVRFTFKNTNGQIAHASVTTVP